MIYQNKESIDENLKISEKLFAENKTRPLLKPQEKDFNNLWMASNENFQMTFYPSSL